MRPTMITIQTLTAFRDEEFNRALGGYTSSLKYQVCKRETAERVDISLELTALDQPYIKTWETTPEELKRYRQYLGEGLSLGAFEDDRVVGLAIAEAHRWNKTLWVWEFGIDPDYRRQGVGRLLMETLAGKARAAGLRALVCETQNTNVPAIRFYRAVDFQVDGIDLSYYTNDDIEKFEVAIFMKRKLMNLTR